MIEYQKSFLEEALVNAFRYNAGQEVQSSRALAVKDIDAKGVEILKIIKT